MNQREYSIRLKVCLFAFLMVSLLAIFIAAVPVRTLSPQVARLRYYALQDGLDGGTLSSSLRDFDWRKSFVWRASDTEYRQRQFTQFFEMLTPRLYAHLYYAFGPFMWLPLSLLCALGTGFLIALVVRQWTGSWLPGLVAGSFWLLTTEVLVGHHAPIRYAKDFAILQILGMLSLLLSLKSPGRRWPAIGGFLLLATLGLFTDEYVLFSFPAFALLLLISPRLRRLRWWLIAAMVVLALASVWLFINVLPYYFSPDFRDPYLQIRAETWTGISSLISRNLSYLALNTLDIFTYTFGSPPPRSGLQIVLAAAAGVVLLLNVLLRRAWKGNGRPIVFWLALAVLAGGVLLPEGTDILHQHTYYNRPLVAVLMVLLGLFSAHVLNSARPAVSWSWLGALALCAVLNFATLADAVRYDPEEAYLTRRGLENILHLHGRLRSGELEPPIFLSYPRHRDATGGVYHELEAARPFTMEDGFPWSLYRALVPRLYLRHFEKGELRVDPRQFTVWAGADEHHYRSEAGYFYDMPEGTVWDLESVRRHARPAPVDLEWRSEAAGVQPAGRRDDLLGDSYFTRLPAGRWEAILPIPEADGESAVVVALRSGVPARLSVETSDFVREFESDYRWSWQLFSAETVRGGTLAGIVVEVGGQAEIIGPVLVPAEAVVFVPAYLRDRIPPAGIPPLRLRGALIAPSPNSLP